MNEIGGVTFIRPLLAEEPDGLGRDHRALQRSVDHVGWLLLE
ncbi:hypothetical protein [Sphingomonas sp. PR090111-T3T-6A]|nr:hypothetical protein [Sphingomonas sp. PR090111-T3T-6A]